MGSVPREPMIISISRALGLDSLDLDGLDGVQLPPERTCGNSSLRSRDAPAMPGSGVPNNAWWWHVVASWDSMPTCPQHLHDVLVFLVQPYLPLIGGTTLERYPLHDMCQMGMVWADSGAIEVVVLSKERRQLSPNSCSCFERLARQRL